MVEGGAIRDFISGMNVRRVNRQAAPGTGFAGSRSRRRRPDKEPESLALDDVKPAVEGSLDS